MAKEIGNIKLYSVKDLCKSLGVNARTVREWFKSGKIKGVKIGTEWHITEENLGKYLNAEEKPAATDPSKLRKKLHP